MKKLNKIIYDKMLIQAEEAKFQGLTKLASNVFEALGSTPDEENASYSKSELVEDIEKDIWKAVTNVLSYHDIDSADAEALDEIVSDLSQKLLEEVESKLDAGGLSSKEEKVLGEENVII
jgi:hypothetical protein